MTIRFTGDGAGGDLDVWVEEGESVGSVKEKVSKLVVRCAAWNWANVFREETRDVVDISDASLVQGTPHQYEGWIGLTLTERNDRETCRMMGNELDCMVSFRDNSSHESLKAIGSSRYMFRLRNGLRM